LQKTVASLFILLASVSYGFLSVFAKLAYDEGVEPFMLSVAQMFFGALFFTFLNVRKLPSFFKIDKKSLLLLLLIGSLSAFTALFYYSSLNLLPASIGIILLFQFVWLGMVFELIKQKRLPNLREIFSTLLCYIGTYFSIGVGADFGSLSLVGLVLGFAAAVAFAGYIFTTSVFCLSYGADVRTFWTIWFAFLSVALFWIFFDAQLNFQTLKWGTLCGLVGVVLPFYLYARFASEIGSAATSMIGSAELPSVLLLSVLFLNEKLDIYGVLGSILVLFAVAVVFLGAAKAK
jgi:drug/metabolite transporter (DMT)-like permease